MTYQEVQNRLDKVQSALSTLQNGNFDNQPSINVPNTINQLQEMEKFLKSQLSIIAEKQGMVATDDEQKAQDLAKKGINVKLTSEMKPGSEEAAEHERMKRLSPKDQETINKIRAMMQAEKDKQLAQDQMDHDQETYDREIGEGDVDAVEDGGDLDIGHQDDEPDMLKQYAYDIATYAAKLYKQLDKYDKMDGEVDFPNWWQSKVILAREYISKAQHYLEFEEKQPAIDQLALEGKEGASKKEEDKFHKDLDTLVHKTFGKRKEEMNEGQAQIKKKLDKINHALQQHKDQTIAISKIPADQRSEEDKAHLAKMVDLTKIKKQLMAQYDDAVSGMGAGQELDANINEYRGVEDDVIEIIKDMALNGDGDEIEAAMEIMEFIGEHYKIDFEFGRAGGGNYGRNDGAPYENVNEAKATCCGRCGRVHVKSGKCTRKIATGSDRCDA